MRNEAVPGCGFFVISGGSGAGKSTLLAALGERGLAVFPEVGRSIVREQVASGGTILPWIDQAAFMEAVLLRQIRDHRDAQGMTAPVFFDRGIPECLAWARILGVGVHAHHLAAVAKHRYDPVVFIAEPWPAIYVTDAERREDFERANASYEPTLAAYVEAGYRLRFLPKSTVADRVGFVLAHAGIGD